MHTRTAALGIFVNLTVEQPLADVTALAHHGQKVVLEMLAAVGAPDSSRPSPVGC